MAKSKNSARKDTVCVSRRTLGCCGGLSRLVIGDSGGDCMALLLSSGQTSPRRSLVTGLPQASLREEDCWLKERSARTPTAAMVLPVIMALRIAERAAAKRRVSNE